MFNNNKVEWKKEKKGIYKFRVCLNPWRTKLNVLLLYGRCV